MLNYAKKAKIATALPKKQVKDNKSAQKNEKDVEFKKPHF